MFSNVPAAVLDSTSLFGAAVQDTDSESDSEREAEETPVVAGRSPAARSSPELGSEPETAPAPAPAAHAAGAAAAPAAARRSRFDSPAEPPPLILTPEERQQMMVSGRRQATLVSTYGTSSQR